MNYQYFFWKRYTVGKKTKETLEDWFIRDKWPSVEKSLEESMVGGHM
jgi:hypothetical protein